MQTVTTSPAGTLASAGIDRGGPAGDRLLLAVAQMRDPVGVLSLYVDASPDRAAGVRPGWHIAAENALRAVRARIDSERPPDRARALRARLMRFDGVTREWLYARGGGRGRALFLPLGGGTPIAIAVQMRLPDLVMLDQTAHVAPLLAAFDAGRPAGVAVASRARVRVLEQRLGSTDELMVLEFDEVTSEWGEIRGAGLANTAVRRPTASARDHYRHRMDERRAWFLQSAGDRLAELAVERGWDTVALCGDRRLTDAVGSRLGADRRIEMVTLAESMDWYSASEVGAAVAAALDRTRSDRQAALASRALDAARGGGSATLGLSQTLPALNEGRVERLLVDMACERRGSRLPDGRLATAGELLPGADPREQTHDDHLTERMVERALETGAGVTPVDGPAAGLLEAHDGVAAMLRW
jgi:hypothetical protein